MAGLFDAQESANRDAVAPLAVRMRPRSLGEFVGQRHFLAEGGLLKRILDADRVGSLIFYGPPGTGKTTLAEIIALQTRAEFVRLNAASCGAKEIREALDAARNRLETAGQKTLLFVDELHHFNRTQQDILLPDVENGIVSLIGATTANPFFSLVSALISRSQVFEFKPIETEDIVTLLRRAMADAERGLADAKVAATDEAIAFLAETADGDVRRALTALEIGVRSLPEGGIFDLHVAQESVQKKALQYDASGDEHYDVISAYIKSLRGSDPDAAVYWLARMLEAGEDPRFIARRLYIAAAEDVGNADPQALLIAQAAAQSVEYLGLPECRIPLSQATIYVACAPKSNASYVAINEATSDVRNKRVLAVPNHLRDKHYSGAKRLGHGEGYLYPHDYEGGYVEQDYLGDERSYYRPTDHGFEAELRRRLEDRPRADRSGDSMLGE